MPRKIVQWAASAARDLEDVDEILSTHNQRAAAELIEMVATAVNSLSSLPRRGRAPPELRTFNVRSEYREIVILRYRLLYRIEGRRLIVVAFFDSRRDAESFLQARLGRGE